MNVNPCHHAHRTHLASFAAAALMAIGCGAKPTEPSTPAERTPTPSGRVLGPNGAPMAGVIVGFSNPENGDRIASVVTDANGHFAPIAPGTYAVAVASAVGWYWEPRLDVTRQPLTLRLSTDCTRFAGRVATDQGVDLDDANVSLMRVSSDYGDRFAIPVEDDGWFEGCLPREASFVVSVDGSALSVPRLVSDASTDALTIAAFPRAKVLEPAPTMTPPAAGLDIPEFVAAIPEKAKIVAIGESNHGSREFLEMRRDISLQLARARGFRVVMIEAGYGEALDLDRYVHGETVDVRKAVERLGYWMWDTEEFLGVLDAFRAYNASVAPDERIHLWGLDVQDTAGSVAVLLASTHLSDAEKALLRRVEPDRGKAWKTLSSAERASVSGALTRIETAKPGTAEALASLALRYRLEATVSSLTQVLLRRDEGMAELTIAASKVAPGGRLILWAHNGHIARGPMDGFPAMGGTIAAVMPDAYYPIGLFQAGGRARAWDPGGAIGVIPNDIPAVEGHQLERALMNATAGKAGLVIPSRLPALAKTWLSTPRYSLEFGASMRREMTLYMTTTAFAALGIVPVVSPTTPTPTGVRKAGK